MSKLRMMHMSLSLSYFRGMLQDMQRRGQAQEFVTSPEGAASYEDAFAYLDEYEAEGYLYVPMSECDNFDGKQGCLGHYQVPS